MSMTYVNAYTYVARAMSRSSDTDRQDSAKDAIKAAIQEWNVRRDWNFLRMDTRNGFTVAACTSNGASPSVITTTTADGFAGVNVNQTATGLSGTVTVASVDSTTQITATTQVTGGPVTLTFSADIPIISGTSQYNLPTPIKRIHTVRLLTNERTLYFKDQFTIDREFLDQTATVVPSFYNNFNSASFTTAREYGRLTLFPIPGITDTCRVRYFRPIAEPSADADLLDIPHRYIYGLLTMARYYFLIGFDAESERTANTERRAEMLFNKAEKDDRTTSIDKDIVAVPYQDWGYHRTEADSDLIFY